MPYFVFIFFLKVVYFRDTEVWLYSVTKWPCSVSVLFSVSSLLWNARVQGSWKAEKSEVQVLGIWDGFETVNTTLTLSVKEFRGTHHQTKMSTSEQLGPKNLCTAPPTSPGVSGPHAESPFTYGITFKTYWAGALQWHHSLTIMM